MDQEPARVPAYVVPMYRAPAGVAWYHFLHGNVPGHQIDFIYRPDVPDGPLTQQHFSHLARLIRYIEPQTNAPFAFAIGNLSRDDVQHEPGHGGLALIIGLRIEGATDHAGRKDPPFSHAIAAIDRSVDDAALIAAAIAFHRSALSAATSEDWYRDYVRLTPEDPCRVAEMLERYVGRFADLPEPTPSTTGQAWIADGAPQPRRIVVVHDDDAAFGEIAVAAARIAAVLYRSDIRWTVISTGREDDIPFGVSVRLVARSNLGSADAAATVHELGDLPDDATALARKLFGATPVAVDEPETAISRFDGAPEPRPPVEEPSPIEDRSVEVDVDIDAPTPEATIRPAPPPSLAPPAQSTSRAPSTPRAPKARWWLFGVFCALAAGILALVALHQRRAAERPVEPPPAPSGQPSSSADSTAPSLAPAPPQASASASSPKKTDGGRKPAGAKPPRPRRAPAGLTRAPQDH